jgi:F420-non-reducing hydrogenase small subunit
MPAADKLKVAFYWAASCGGCEISVLEINEKILDLADAADIVFWPAAIDAKYDSLESMAPNSVDLCLFNGGIRTTEHRDIANLLRSLSRTMIAYGSCACEGCIPGLANLATRESIFARVYEQTPSTTNPDRVRPQPSTKMPEGAVTLPRVLDRLKPLDTVVSVDYYVPGCPPTGEQTWRVLEGIISGKPLPPPGATIGVDAKTVCDHCPLERSEKRIKRFYRPHEIVPEPGVCLLEQGLICCGPATRAGCNAACIQANMPCRGCYGPPEGVRDQGARMIGAITSIIDSRDPDEIRDIVEQIPDPIGTFYRFGLANSTLSKKKP